MPISLLHTPAAPSAAGDIAASGAGGLYAAPLITAPAAQRGARDLTAAATVASLATNDIAAGGAGGPCAEPAVSAPAAPLTAGNIAAAAQDPKDNSTHRAVDSSEDSSHVTPPLRHSALMRAQDPSLQVM